jgi:hypothetical protein
MVGFGYKMVWVAVRAGEAEAIFDALGLSQPRTVDWPEGVRAVYQDHGAVALTPALPGADGTTWTLAIGQSLSTVDLCELSRRLDREVQRFGTHRVVEWHRWERVVSGTLVRVFEYVGDGGHVTVWEGEPDEVERAVGLPPVWPIVEGATIEPGAAVEPPDGRVNEMDLMRVAGGWSVDPTGLDGLPAPGPLTLATAPVTAPRRRWWWERRRA